MKLYKSLIAQLTLIGLLYEMNQSSNPPPLTIKLSTKKKKNHNFVKPYTSNVVRGGQKTAKPDPPDQSVRTVRPFVRS